MNTEKILVKLQFCKSEIKTVYLFIYDEIENKEDSVILEIETDDKSFRSQSDNYFDTLKELRRCLEKENIQLMCNGAGKNVYPSPMHFSMGNTRKAYKTYLGQQTRMSDLIDIFDYEEGLDFVTIEEQLKFNKEWIEGFLQK